MKVSFGGGVADGRGSIGGVTFSRNRYGSYARKRVVPVNPNTSEQVRARSTFQAAVTAWRQLTDAQRAAWANYAAQTPVQDKLGATIYLTGLQAFMSVQGPARTYAAHDIGFVASIPKVPTVTGGIQQDDITSIVSDGDISDATLDITVTGPTTPGGLQSANPGEYAILYLSRPVSNETNFFKGPWIYTRRAVSSGPTPENEISFTLAQLAEFGIVPTTKSKLFMKFVRFSTTNTRIPVERIASVTFEA